MLLIKKLIFLFVVITTVAYYCLEYHHTARSLSNTMVSCDLDSIRKRGKLIAVTDFNSTDYFIYKGEPMGFNFELLKSFSDNIGIDLEIVSENHIDKAIGMLNSGEADLLAFNLTVNPSMEKDVLLTSPICETRQVLVQRKPKNWISLTEQELDKNLIRSQQELAKKTIYVQAGSAHAEQLPFFTGY